MKRCPVCGATYPNAQSQFCSNDGTVLVAVDPYIGTTLEGKYRIESKLGAGGMGAVYKAHHLLLGRDVAVKVLRSEMLEDAKSAERFRREAQAAARLEHPNAVTIYDFGITGEGNAYLVMELLRGTSLRDVLDRDGRLSLPRTVEIFSQVCAGIDRAHQLGIVHRDIKPDNVMVDERPDGSVGVKVVDFGIALLQDAVNESGRLTGTGLIVGTANYMSPEHCRGQAMDARSDVYSLGIVLYEMLVGTVPFKAPIVSAVIVAHVNEPPPPIGPSRPDVPPSVERVVMSALAKRPEDRPQAAGELARRLASAAGGAAETAVVPVSAATTAPVERVSTGGQTVHQTAPQAGGPPGWSGAMPATAASVGGERRGLSALQVTLIAVVTLAAGFAIAAATLGVMNWRDSRNENIAAGNTAPPVENRAAPPPATNTAPPPTNTAPPIVLPPAEKPPVPEPEPEPAPADDVPAAGDGVRGEVEQLLGDWTSSSMARDIRGHIRHYADVVDYYNAGPVPRARVRVDRARAYERYDTLDIRIPKIYSISVDRGSGDVTVVFDKQWRFSGAGGDSVGKVKQRLVLRRLGGELRIVSERDLAVY